MDFRAQAELNRQKRRQANQERSRSITQIATIGQRQNNGRYDVQTPDGSLFQGKGIKIFNAAHSEGDTVVAIPRRDGAILLEGPKATPDPAANNNLALPALRDKCESYLRGKIFNCAEPDDRERTTVWGLGYFVSGGNRFYQLINLLTGQNYGLGGVPEQIPPCPVNNDPPDPPDPPPPSDPDDPWYLHQYTQAPWAPNFGSSTCGSRSGPGPAEPDTIENVNTTTDFTLLAPDGRYWNFRIETGTWTQNGTPSQFFTRNTMTIYTQSDTPPGFVAGTHYITSSNATAGDAFAFDPANFTYSSSGCPPTDAEPPLPPEPPRDDNGPPIPNTIDVSLSLDAAGGPIAYIRHTPNCIFGTYAFDRSFVLNEFDAVRSIQGKLSSDWRYGDPFPCRDSWASDDFANISDPRIWQIAPADRPGTLASNTPTETTIAKGRLDSNNCTTPVSTGEKNITIRQNNNAALTIVAIAASIKKR